MSDISSRVPEVEEPETSLSRNTNMAQPTQSIAEIDFPVHEKSEALYGANSSQSTGIEALPSSDDEGEVHMSKAKWLALFALGTAYMTHVQQGACIAMIVKSIDIALGIYLIAGVHILAGADEIHRPNDILQLASQRFSHHGDDVLASCRRSKRYLWQTLVHHFRRLDTHHSGHSVTGCKGHPHADRCFIDCWVGQWCIDAFPGCCRRVGA